MKNRILISLILVAFWNRPAYSQQLLASLNTEAGSFVSDSLVIKVPPFDKYFDPVIYLKTDGDADITFTLPKQAGFSITANGQAPDNVKISKNFKQLQVKFEPDSVPPPMLMPQKSDSSSVIRLPIKYDKGTLLLVFIGQWKRFQAVYDEWVDNNDLQLIDREIEFTTFKIDEDKSASANLKIQIGGEKVDSLKFELPGWEVTVSPDHVGTAAKQVLLKLEAQPGSALTTSDTLHLDGWLHYQIAGANRKQALNATVTVLAEVEPSPWILIGLLSLVAVITGALWAFRKKIFRKKEGAPHLGETLEGEQIMEIKLGILETVLKALKNEGEPPNDSEEIKAKYVEIKGLIFVSTDTSNHETEKKVRQWETALGAQQPSDLPEPIKKVFDRLALPIFLPENTQLKTVIIKLKQLEATANKEVLDQFVNSPDFKLLSNDEKELFLFVFNNFKTQLTKVENRLEEHILDTKMALNALGLPDDAPAGSLTDAIEGLQSQLRKLTLPTATFAITSELQGLLNSLSKLEKQSITLDNQVGNNSLFKPRFQALIVGGNGIRGIQRVRQQWENAMGMPLSQANFFENIITDEFREVALNLAKLSGFAQIPEVGVAMEADGADLKELGNAWKTLEAMLKDVGLQVTKLKLGKDIYTKEKPLLEPLSSGAELSTMGGHRFSEIVRKLPDNTIFDLEQVGFQSKTYDIPSEYQRTKVFYKNW